MGARRQAITITSQLRAPARSESVVAADGPVLPHSLRKLALDDTTRADRVLCVDLSLQQPATPPEKSSVTGRLFVEADPRRTCRISRIPSEGGYLIKYARRARQLCPGPECSNANKKKTPPAVRLPLIGVQTLEQAS